MTTGNTGLSSERGSAQKPAEVKVDDGVSTRIAALEAGVQEIQRRNSRVERNKAWETSRTRTVSITLVTYITMVLVFAMLGSSSPGLDALVPTTGFFLSTLTLPIVRGRWERAQEDRETNRSEQNLKRGGEEAP